jgi:hypothetical protein
MAIGFGFGSRDAIIETLVERLWPERMLRGKYGPVLPDLDKYPPWRAEAVVSWFAHKAEQRGLQPPSMHTSALFKHKLRRARPEACWEFPEGSSMQHKEGFHDAYVYPDGRYELCEYPYDPKDSRNVRESFNTRTLRAMAEMLQLNADPVAPPSR